MQSYADHTHRLIAEGKGYYCFCSAELLEAHRKAQLAAGLPPKYAGTCRNIAIDEARRRKEHGEPAVVRLRVPEGRNVTFNDVVRGEVTFHTDVIGDPVLVRSDGIPAYNFAVVIDDALMKVTHVIRGEDHISNTPRQIPPLRSIRVRAADVRAPVAGDGTRSCAALQASRRDLGA
jgi:glutamyl/glutaminyl-tRNA synthetase